MRQNLIIFAMAFGLAAQAGNVRIFSTTADGTEALKCTIQETTSTMSANRIRLVPTTEFQSMDGFGYGLTYSSCYNLMKMNPLDRHEFLRKTFSPERGFGVSYCRVSIGCSDFSSRVYTLCDTKGLGNFALQSDEKDYLIPILKEILEINPQMKIIGSPWTCPRWMKVENLNSTQPYNHWTNGHLNPQYYSDYAQYFVKFVEAFRQHGIDIYAVTPQNEPLNRGNCASLYMPWEEEAAFLKHLAPAFSKAGLKTKIYVFDHNYNYDGVASQVDYPVNVYNALDDTMEGSELVVGAAYHDYGGNVSELTDIHNQAPTKELIFTESSIGTWNDGRNLGARLLTDMNNLVLSTATRYCRAVMVWNLMLDTRRGPNLDGGCTTCYGAVDISADDYHTITANSHYYIIAHASVAVQPGAVRIRTSGSTIDNVSHVAFRNPDNSYAILLVNNSSSSRTVSIFEQADAVATVTLSGKSVTSVVIGADEEPELKLGGQVMANQAWNRYTLTTELRQGQAYDQNFVDSEHWYVDPDFFLRNGEGELIFKPLSGLYTVSVDLSNQTLLVSPEEVAMSADGMGNVYVIGAANSIGKPHYGGGKEWELENAIPMARVSQKVYQLTFTVGEQLNPASVDFGFYGARAWTPQFMGTSGSAYKLSYSSKVESFYFNIGMGRQGHENGHIFLRSSSMKLTPGDTYVCTVDLTNGVGDGMVSITKQNATSVLPVDLQEQSSTAPIYNLGGQQLQQKPKKGVYLQGSKKTL